MTVSIEIRARELYDIEYADELDAPTFEEADGWEKELFRRRAWDSLKSSV